MNFLNQKIDRPSMKYIPLCLKKKKVYCILLDENKNEKKDTPSHQVGINTSKGPVGHMPKLFNRGSAIVPTAKRDKTTKGHHLVINNIKKSYQTKNLIINNKKERVLFSGFLH